MINTHLYWVFLLVAIPTILSPGPGVLMSLTNSMRYGLKSAQPGIVGVASGTLVVGFVSVTGLGVVIATSETLYGAIRVLGILFLLYLGYKKFRAKPFAIRLAHIENEEYADTPVENVNKKNLFIEGVLLQISNPALIIFICPFSAVHRQNTDLLAASNHSHPELRRSGLAHSLYVRMVGFVGCGHITKAQRRRLDQSCGRRRLLAPWRCLPLANVLQLARLRSIRTEIVRLNVII